MTLNKETLQNISAFGLYGPPSETELVKAMAAELLELRDLQPAAVELRNVAETLVAAFEGRSNCMAEYDASFFVDNAGQIFLAAMEARAALSKAGASK